MSKCEICGKDGFHKLSCTNNTSLLKVMVDLQEGYDDAYIKMREVISNQSTINTYIPTLEGDEAEEFVRKADENVKAMRQRRCKNHVWRKDYLNGGKKCQVCGKTKEEPTRAKDVEP